MNGNMTDNFVDKIKERVHEKIEQGDTNGDIAWWTLAIVSDTHEKMEEANNRLKTVEENPSIKFGTFIKERPFIAWAISQITALILVVTSLAIALGLIDKLGLALVVKP